MLSFMQKYDILLLDADGTLFDFKRSEREALTEALMLQNIIADEDSVSQYVKINDGLWKQFERGEISKDDIRRLRFIRLSEYMGIGFDTVKMGEDYVMLLGQKRYLLEGALECCKQLHRHARLYIITNGIHSVQMSRIKNSPINRYITDIFVSEQVGYAKPRKEYFDYVFQNIENFRKDKALVVGDSLTSDIAGGIASGTDVCWLNPEGEPVPGEMHINYVVDCISKLPDIILNSK